MSVLADNFDTHNYDFISAYYNEDHDLGLSLSGMFKESNKADLRGARGDYNWSNSMDNFEEDFAFDGKLQYKKLTLGFVFQDKKASRATKFRTLDTSLRDNGTHWHIRFMNTYAKYTCDKSQNGSWHSQVYLKREVSSDDRVTS